MVITLSLSLKKKKDCSIANPIPGLVAGQSPALGMDTLVPLFVTMDASKQTPCL